MITSLLLAEGLAQLGCGIGAGIAVIGAGLGIGKIGGSDRPPAGGFRTDLHPDDSDISLRRGLCSVRYCCLCILDLISHSKWISLNYQQS